MAATIRVLPSGRQFVSDGNASLLMAGLRAGLAFDYACSNGNCGQCLARIVSGEVEKTQNHDYIISEQLKASGHVLMCCNSALGDVVIEAPEASGADEIPCQMITARVRNIQLVTEGVALLHLKTPRNNRLRFLAGQYVELGFGGGHRAKYSIASCPCDDMNLHFQVPLSKQNDLENQVIRQLRRGDMVEITGPYGDFILDENSTRPLVFIAWRTGFAPIRSLVEHAMALDLTETMQLVWFAESSQDRYLDNLCRSWKDAYDEFRYIPVDLDMDKPASSKTLQTIQQTMEVLNHPADCDVYIAANEFLLDSCTLGLSGLGPLPGRLLSDALGHR